MSSTLESLGVGEAYARSVERERRADEQFKNTGGSEVVAARYAETAGRIEAAQERERERKRQKCTDAALHPLYDPSGWVDTTTETDITRWLIDTEASALEAPGSIRRPSGMKHLKGGDLVKVCDKEQRFWAVVTRVEDASQWIVSRVDSCTGREDRGYGREQLVRFQRKHVYFRNSAAEGRRIAAQLKMLEMIKSGVLKEPNDDQDKLRRVCSYAEDNWEREPDMFEQGTSDVETAMSEAPSHARVLAYYNARPDLLARCGLKAGDIGIVYICNRAQMRKTLIECSDRGAVVTKENVEQLYQCGFNLAVEHKLVCEAMNEPDPEEGESDAEAEQ